VKEIKDILQNVMIVHIFIFLLFGFVIITLNLTVLAVAFERWQNKTLNGWEGSNEALAKTMTNTVFFLKEFMDNAPSSLPNYHK